MPLTSGLGSLGTAVSVSSFATHHHSQTTARPIDAILHVSKTICEHHHSANKVSTDGGAFFQSQDLFAPPPQSFAQTCNDDVLDTIFSSLPKTDVASAALTCKRWTGSAYRALYSSLAFSPSYAKGTILMQRLSPTLMESDAVRHVIRRLSIDAGGVVWRQTPHHLYDWLRLLPADTLLSLYVCPPPPQDHGTFLGILLQSPSLHSIQYLSLNMYFEELSLEDVTSLPQLLASAPNVSHLSVKFPAPKDFDTLPRYCKPWTCAPCVRHILATMWIYNPRFGDLLTATRASLETLICDIVNGLVFHSELIRALEATFTSPLRTVFLSTQNVEHEHPLLVLHPGVWSHLRELVLSGWRLQWDLLSECLPPSLETLVLKFTFFEPFPIRQLAAFVERTPTLSSSVFSRLAVCGAPRYYFRHGDLDKLDDVCSRCGVSLQIYSDAISCPSLREGGAWTLQGMLATMRLSPA